MYKQLGTSHLTNCSDCQTIFSVCNYTKIILNKVSFYTTCVNFSKTCVCVCITATDKPMLLNYYFIIFVDFSLLLKKVKFN